MADKALVKQAVEQCLKFTEALTGVPFYPYERQFAIRFIESVILNDGEELTALFARQSGKSETVADCCAGMAVILPFMARLPQYAPLEEFQRFQEGIWIGMFAPILDQSQTIFDRLRGRLGSKQAESVLNIPQIAVSFETSNGSCVSLNNGSFVECMSASDNSHIESKTYHIVVIDECQEVSNSKIRKSIHPMLASTNGTIVKIGTSFTRRGDFYDAIQRNKKLRDKTGIRNHFEYDYNVVQKYNPRYSKFIEKELVRLGEDSDEFRMSYKLEWILERGMAVSSESLDLIGMDYDILETYRGAPLCAGIDLAKESDSTVVTIVEPNYGSITSDGFMTKKIIDWLELYGDDYESQFYQIMDYLSKFSVEKICIDSTGVGDPISDRLIAHCGDIQVIPFKFSSSTCSDLYKLFLNDINGRRILFPNSLKAQKLLRQRKFIRQMLDWEKYYTGQYLICDHPDEKDAHDDYPVSAALACWACKEEGIPSIIVGDNGFYGR